MTNMRRTAGGALCALLSLYSAGCCSGPDNIGVKSELNGLSSSIQRIDRVGDQVEVVYGLEWSSATPSWDLKAIEPVVATFRDRDGGALTPAAPPAFISLEEEFLRLDEKQTSTTLRVPVPAGASTLSLALGASGLETPRVVVP
jgi:hypothetical protein